jgi:hypothetical protein
VAETSTPIEILRVGYIAKKSGEFTAEQTDKPFAGTSSRSHRSCITFGMVSMTMATARWTRLTR